MYLCKKSTFSRSNQLGFFRSLRLLQKPRISYTLHLANQKVDRNPINSAHVNTVLFSVAFPLRHTDLITNRNKDLHSALLLKLWYENFLSFYCSCQCLYVAVGYLYIIFILSAPGLSAVYFVQLCQFIVLFPWHTLSLSFNASTGSLSLLGLKIAADYMLVKALLVVANWDMKTCMLTNQ